MMDPPKNFVLRDRASSIVECGLINRNQKVQIFHPASIRICKKILSGKKKGSRSWQFGRDSQNLMIMTISFHPRLLLHFTIIFAAALPHGKMNLRTTFSFSRWAKPPDNTNNSEQTHSNKLWVWNSIEVCRFHSTSNYLVNCFRTFSVFKYYLIQNS